MEIVSQEEKGPMIALVPDPLPPYLNNTPYTPHITLWLGGEELNQEVTKDGFLQVVQEVVGDFTSIIANYNGFLLFPQDEGHVLTLGITSESQELIYSLQDRLTSRLKEYGWENQSSFTYTPHLTLEYGFEGELPEWVEGDGFVVHSVYVFWGEEEVVRIPFPDPLPHSIPLEEERTAMMVETPDGVGKILEESPGHFPRVLVKGAHFEGWYPKSSTTILEGRVQSTVLPEDWWEWEGEVTVFSDSGEEITGYVVDEYEGDVYTGEVSVGNRNLASSPFFSEREVAADWVNSVIESYLSTGQVVYPSWTDQHRVGSFARTLKNSAWEDVMRKAKSLRSEGKVNVLSFKPEFIKAKVEGHTGVYDVEISRGLGDTTHIDHWSCNCGWGEWAFKREVTYIGRMCSHALATYHEMMAQTYHHNVEQRNSATGWERFEEKSWDFGPNGTGEIITEVWSYQLGPADSPSSVLLVEENPSTGEFHAYIEDRDGYITEDLGYFPTADEAKGAFGSRVSSVEVKAPLTPEEEFLEWAAANGFDPGVDSSYQAFLDSQRRRGRMSRVAGKNYTLAEQDALINEKGTARHLPHLNLTGTHYEEMEDGTLFFF